MWAPPDVVVPVTVITKLWVPAARPEAVNTAFEASPGLPGVAAPAVLTDVAAPPSMDTVAIPQTLHSRPIQLTAVPVKLSAAVAPGTFELPAAPPLKAATSGPRRTHASAGRPLTAALSSCNRVTGVLRRMAALWLFKAIAPTIGMDSGGEFKLSCVSCRAGCSNGTETTSSVAGLTYT